MLLKGINNETFTGSNPHFITYQTEFLTIDVLGGVDLIQIERMICTLRISYQDYLPFRSTLDLYNDSQSGLNDWFLEECT